MQRPQSWGTPRPSAPPASQARTKHSSGGDLREAQALCLWGSLKVPPSSWELHFPLRCVKPRPVAPSLCISPIPTLSFGKVDRGVAPVMEERSMEGVPCSPALASLPECHGEYPCPESCSLPDLRAGESGSHRPQLVQGAYARKEYRSAWGVGPACLQRPPLAGWRPLGPGRLQEMTPKGPRRARSLAGDRPRGVGGSGELAGPHAGAGSGQALLHHRPRAQARDARRPRLCRASKSGLRPRRMATPSTALKSLHLGPFSVLGKCWGRGGIGVLPCA